MSNIPFLRDLDFSYGRSDQLSPLIRRVIARNPSPFTFHGTGTYIVGRGNVAVIDPGPDLEEHRDALVRALEGEQVTHIFVTHTHDDHSGGAKALQDVVGAPTYAFGPHPDNPASVVEEGADESFIPDHLLADGVTISEETWSMQALHTPGHLANHVCFALECEGALFTGDHVMGWSTSVIVPPSGHMGDYLRNLRRLLQRSDRIYYPTHGCPIENPHEFVRALIQHRQEREATILTCVNEGICDVTEIVSRLYKNVPPYLHPAASQSVRAHLIHLREQGRLNLAKEELA